ncbi:MAG: ABC transporter substrate-binding protein [Chloroflexota bacterium]|nr:ABC transporter substrate-binding protein [Chloroflexia bacterium]MDQ3541603.1 ABC transporter substrate-binding protein [Chloroflexota bacterium]
MTGTRVWPLLLVGAIFLAACGSAEETRPATQPGSSEATGQNGEAEAPEQSEEFLEASVAVVNNMAHLPVFVAQEFGLWTDRGLDVDVQTLGSGADIAAALGAGEAEFAAVNAGTGVAPQRASGLMTKLVAPYNNDATNAMYVDWIGIVGRSDAGVTTDPKSLVGKRIAVTSGGTPFEYWREWIAKEGFKDDQFDVVTMEPPDMLTSIVSGDVDAVVPWSPFLTAARSRLGDNAVDVSTGEPLLLSAIGLGAVEGQVEEKEEIFRRMIEGLVEATSLIRQDPESVAPVVLSFVEGIDEAEAVEAMAENVYDPRISVCTRHGVEVTSKTLVREGTVDETFKADELLDSRLLDEVLEANPDLISDLPPLPEKIEDCRGVGE